MLPHNSMGSLIQQNTIAVFFGVFFFLQQFQALLFLLPSFLGLFSFCLVNGGWGDKRYLLLVFLWHVHPERRKGSNENIVFLWHEDIVFLSQVHPDPRKGTKEEMQ